VTAPAVAAATLARAQQGDPRALEVVLRSVEDLVYGLALRALWHVDDAQDCTQEALAAVARGLPAFRGDSALTTWVTAITVREVGRHRSLRRTPPVPAGDALAGIDHASSPTEPCEPAGRLVAEELELACASGMLTLLSVPVRLAYVLGDVLELPDQTGAALLGIGPAAYRQRLARARSALRTDLDRRLTGGADLWPPPADATIAARAGRAGRELARMRETEPPVNLSTPDFVARLRASYPGLLAELPSTSATAEAASSATSTPSTS
jgi:DNA-directed RNA polymerase specialized sigma24 family protein